MFLDRKGPDWMRPIDIDSLSEEELIELNHKVVARLRFLSVRTTHSIVDDTFRLVKRYAASRSLALGKAVPELVRRALTTPRPTRSLSGLRVFDLAPESPKVSSKKVRTF
jgi:hypothetical protein